MLYLLTRRTSITWSLILFGMVLFAAIHALPAMAQEQSLPVIEPEVNPERDPQQEQEQSQDWSYVSDQLEITLRRGAGTKFGITRMLKSGTPVLVVEENNEGYTRVTTNDGITGWVLSRFLQSEPVARQRLTENEYRMQTMRREAARLEEQFKGMQQLQDNLSRVMVENQALSKELQQVKAVAAESLAINEENKVLKKTLEESRGLHEKLIEKSRQLEEDTEQRWFLIGGAVIFAGILIGLILPKIRWKRRSAMSGGINMDL